MTAQPLIARINLTRLTSSRGQASGFACRAATAARPTAGPADLSRFIAGPASLNMQPGLIEPCVAIPGGRGWLRIVSPNLPETLRGRAVSVPGFLGTA